MATPIAVKAAHPVAHAVPVPSLFGAHTHAALSRETQVEREL